MNTKSIVAIAAIMLASCGNKENQFDATGTFETVETIVSAEANGTIKAFNIEEGQQLKAGQAIGYIDTIQLSLKKKQFQAQISSVLSRKPNINAETAALQEELKHAKSEQNRVASLVKADAATRKQLDDATSQIEVIRKRITAQQSTLGTATSGLNEDAQSLKVQVDQIDDQIAKSKIVNAINGSVITKYAEANEMAAIGKPLYKIADMSTVILRAYITGNQFAKVKTGQQVTVYVDSDSENYRKYQGIVEWISDKAEFTPKTIQTKDERANLVYAIKVRVKNDGLLKIGMYGEIRF
ncbi:MAG TPA: HlyD family efflux transporter periplasmic adaptor subunit [Flavobacterium sp.]|nr:HlyD family efflux transporter periplasmic adaptor subunit [Flavobacterium sp.]